MARGIAHSKAIWHRATDVWVVNGTKVLCQQRSLKKDTNPGKWQTNFGGHAAPGQSYVSCAKQELFEETGIDLPEKAFRQVLIYKNTQDEPERNFADREHLGAFMVSWKGSVEDLKTEEDEVEQVVWKEAVDILKEFNPESWANHGYEKNLLSKIATGKNWGEL